MGPVVRFRSRGAQVLGATMMAAAVLCLLTLVIGGLDQLLRFGAPVVLFGVLGWAAFWAPYVEVSDGGVALANTLRTVEVPWPAVEGVDGRYGLTLRTSYGALTAWAAPSPAGRQRARSQPSEAAHEVESRLAELRAAGYLDDARLERPAPRVTWHRSLLVALGILAAATVLLPFAA